MSQNIFLSYSHSDNEENLWLERLKGFLDALQDQLPLNIWTDSMINNGDNWRNSIDLALSNSVAAILLVGRGFLASKFINEKELPHLLSLKNKNNNLYILYVGFCPWKQSLLEPYKAFNNPDQPLESLSKPNQNKCLNELVVKIQNDLVKNNIAFTNSIPSNDLKYQMDSIKTHLEITKTAINTQLKRANILLNLMTKRLEINEHSQYEQFFFKYYDFMNEEEHFQFNQIRSLTEGILFKNNNAILKIIEENPTLRNQVPILGALKIHLTIWVNKYKKIFSFNKKMAVCFTGVEDGVPFPFGVDEEVDNWIQIHQLNT